MSLSHIIIDYDVDSSGSFMPVATIAPTELETDQERNQDRQKGNVRSDSGGCVGLSMLPILCRVGVAFEGTSEDLRQ